MIAKLRRRHRLIFPVLAILIVVVVTFGLKEKPQYSNSELPGYSNIIPGDLVRESNINDEWDDNKISSVLYFSEVGQSYYLKFIDRNYTNEADLLLYLNENPSKEISESSKLIGKFTDDNSVYHKLPVTVLEDASIILYSLPKKRIIAVASISKREDSK